MTTRCVTFTTGASLLAGISISLLAASPAVADQTLTVGPATLLAKGNQAALPVTFVCPEGESPEFYVYLTRTTGKQETYGLAERGFTCTGDTQTERVIISSTGAPFKPGRASYYISFNFEIYEGVTRIKRR